MKNNKFRVLLLALMMVFTVALAACTPEKPAPLEIEGFDVRSSISVSYGESVEVEQPIVTDEKGNVLDVWHEVKDSKGNYVEVTAGRFTAQDIGGYTITYVVRASDNYSYDKSTTVSVSGSTNGEITLGATYDRLVDIGSSVTITPNCSNESATYTYEVKKGDTPVEVTNASFTVATGGTYTVKITTDGISYEYDIVARAPMTRAEVEVFDDTWKERELVTNGSRDYDIVTSEESGVYDRFGRAGSFAKISSSLNYTYFKLMPRASQEYYRALADEGYTKVSVWVYMKSEKNISHITRVDRDPHGKYYMGGDSPALLPNQWVEIKMNLVDTKNVYSRSFVSLHPYYTNDLMNFMLIDNCVDNPAGQGDTMEFYFADIYAVKETEVTPKDSVVTEYSVGDTLEFSSVIENSEEYDYFITTRGERTLIDADSYTFTSNGEYDLEIVPAAKDLEGKASLTFTVTNAFTYSGNAPIVERTGESVEVSFASLNAAFSATEGTAPTVESYKVTYNGTEIETTAEGFTALRDGCYDIEISGTYQDGESEYTAYAFTTVDVFSAESKYELYSVDRLVGVANSASATRPTITEGEYTVAGRTDKMIRIDRNHSATSLYFRPLYSKGYYEALAAENPNLYLNFEFSTEGTGTHHIQYCMMGYRNNPSGVWSSTNESAWGTKRTINFLINNYDNIVSAYNKVNKAIETATWYEGVTENESADTERLLYTWKTNATDDIYIDDFSLKADATTTTLALKSGVTLDVVDSALDSHDVYELFYATLDGNSAEIIRIDVKYNGEWIRLTESREFAPVWDGAYEFKVTARANGLIGATTQSISTSGTAVELIDDTTYRELKSNGSFDAKTTINLPAYNLTYVVTRVTGASELACEVTLDANGVLQGSNEYLEEGLYKITAWASKPEFVGNPYNDIAIYSLYVDYIESETGVLIADLEQDTIDNYTQAYYQGGNVYNQVYKANSVTFDNKQVIKLGNGDKKYNWGLQIVPVHSKGYYEKLLAINENYQISFSYYIESDFETVEVNNFLYDVAASAVFAVPGQWYTASIDLSYIVDNWDLVSAQIGKTDTTNWAKKSILVTGYHTQGHSVVTYIGDFSFGYTATVTAEPATVTLGETYDLAEVFTAKIGDDEATITKVELKDGTNWIEVPNLSFTPSWNSVYTARISAVLGEGTGTVETTLTVEDSEGNTFTPLTNAGFFLTTDDGLSVDLSTVFDATDITFTYTAQRVEVNSKTTATAPTVTEGRLTAGEGWTPGVYEITATATKAEGFAPFNSISYGVFTVDYDLSKDTKILLPDYTQATLDARTQVYYQSGNAYNKVYKAIATTFDGKEVIKVGNGEKKYNWGYQIVPVHSKAYYENLLTENENYRIYFNYYIDSVYSTVKILNFLYGDSYIGFKATPGRWYTATVSISDMLTNWDLVYSAIGSSDTSTWWKKSIFVTGYHDNSDPVVAYLEGFKVGYDDPIASATTTVDLGIYEISANATYNLGAIATTDAETNANKDKFNFYWKLTSLDDTVIEEATDTLSTVGLDGPYTVERIAKSVFSGAETTVYKAKLEFYDITAATVALTDFANASKYATLTVRDVYGAQGVFDCSETTAGSKKGAVTVANTFEGAEKLGLDANDTIYHFNLKEYNYYGITLAPYRSIAVLQAYEDAGYTISIPIYHRGRGTPTLNEAGTEYTWSETGVPKIWTASSPENLDAETPTNMGKATSQSVITGEWVDITGGSISAYLYFFYDETNVDGNYERVARKNNGTVGQIITNGDGQAYTWYSKTSDGKWNANYPITSQYGDDSTAKNISYMGTAYLSPNKSSYYYMNNWQLVAPATTQAE